MTIARAAYATAAAVRPVAAEATLIAIFLPSNRRCGPEDGAEEGKVALSATMIDLHDEECRQTAEGWTGMMWVEMLGGAACEGQPI
jgi:hypothetical protein